MRLRRSSGWIVSLSAATVVSATLVAGAASAPAQPAGPLAGRTVYLDPGHSGANDHTLTSQVPTGRGGTKDCQTTGTSTNDGYAEHTFTWQLAELVRGELVALGAHVLLSRSDDSSVGSCVDRRAQDANDSAADAVVSLHADGAAADAHGFHVNYSAPPLNETQAGPSVSLATSIRDALVTAGITPSTYLGVDGLVGRDDLTGLNLSQRPSVLVETGNMRNANDAALMTDPAGRAQLARAVVAGIVVFLG
ncbi:MAG: Rv3717 family N-acetylmuramoyl-L-alanine amidase [Rhodococcus sp. (in: high G+C Gram-positive bacteria)]|uniref:Rv3717 family N-acetylmuramoyl-L-alanine amidase n=1 Tax=Rhodococcus sp. TaxID=1831 RepID=UPI003BB5DCE5